MKTHVSASGLARRDALKLLAAGGLGSLGAARGPSIAIAATATWDWKKHSGQTIRALVYTGATTDFVEKLLAEFTELTGIRVNWEKIGEDQQRQKLQVELTSGMTDLDIYMSHVGQQGKAFMQAGWYELLDPLIKDTRITSPDWDHADIDANLLEQLAAVNGKLVGIPMYAITFPLYYRKDLFQEAGLAVPKTFEEMEAAAKKLTDKSKSQFGMLLRGQAAPAVGVWPAFLYNFGGNWFTPDGKPAINTPESVESLMFYGRLAREYGPPGALNLNWPQLSDMFAQGRGAMFCDSSSLVVRWEDPQKSKVVDKVGYALLPGGKGGQQPALNTPLWAIYAKSRKKEAAWTFIQWAAGKEMCARMQRAGITQPRRSAWQDVQFQKDFGARHPDFTDTLLQSYTRGKAFLYPPFVNVALARDTYGEVIAISIRGGDVKAAADAAQAKLLEQQRKEAAG